MSTNSFSVKVLIFLEEFLCYTSKLYVYENEKSAIVLTFACKKEYILKSKICERMIGKSKMTS